MVEALTLARNIFWFKYCLEESAWLGCLQSSSYPFKALSRITSLVVRFAFPMGLDWLRTALSVARPPYVRDLGFVACGSSPTDLTQILHAFTSVVCW